MNFTCLSEYFHSFFFIYSFFFYESQKIIEILEPISFSIQNIGNPNSVLYYKSLKIIKFLSQNFPLLSNKSI